MITDLFLKLLTSPILLLLEGLSVISFSIPVGVFSGLKTLAHNLGYIFPISSILPILVIKFMFRYASFAWTLILKIKSFIPTMGD